MYIYKYKYKYIYIYISKPRFSWLPPTDRTARLGALAGARNQPDGPSLSIYLAIYICIYLYIHLSI